MKARGKSRLCRDVAPGNQLNLRPALQGRNTYFGPSGLGAFLVYVTRGDALRACPWLLYSAPLALAFICGLYFLSDREPDLKTRIAGLRLETHVAAMFADDARDGVEAQAGSLADWLGSEEWLEDA